MTEINHEQISQTTDTQVQLPKRSVEAIAAEQSARNAAVQAEYGAAMTEEEGYQRIGEALLVQATDGGDGEQHLGPYLEHAAFPEEINRCLWQYQCKKQQRRPDYDITQEPPRRLARILQKELSLVVDRTKTEEAVVVDEERLETAETEDAETAQESEAITAYDEQITKWKSDPEWNAKSNLAKVSDILAHPDVPESEKAKWAQFQAVLSIASANPQDAAIISAKFEQVDVFNAPNAAGFARSFIFDSPDSQIKTGVSEATQLAVATSLGITLPKQEPKTGGDANDIYKRGGTETYIDEETGETKTRQVPLPKDARVPFTDEAELGFDDQGNKTAWITTEVGVFQAKLPENPTDEDLGNVIRTTQLRGKLHALNVAHIVYPDVTIEERGGGPITVQPWHYKITDKFLETVVSNRAVAGNNLLSQPDLDEIPYLMQFHDRKGDAGIADVNPEQTVEDYRAQGIIDESGTLDWERFTALVSANRGNLYNEANFKANVDEGLGEI